VCSMCQMATSKSIYQKTIKYINEFNFITKYKMATKLIKGIDEDLWCMFRAMCIRRRLKVGEALNDILDDFLRKEEKNVVDRSNVYK